MTELQDQRIMTNRIRFICLVLSLSIPLSSIHAQELHIDRADLSSGVEKTVAAQCAGATVRGFSVETEKGKTFYEMSPTVNARAKDIPMNDKGATIEIGEEADLQLLSAEVRARLRAKAANATVLKVEALTKSGKLVAYEAPMRGRPARDSVQARPFETLNLQSTTSLQEN